MPKNVFLYDSVTGMTELLSRAADGTPANGPSTRPCISGDGRWVAFVTSATNLVGGIAPGTSRIVRLDRRDHSFTLVDTLDGPNLARSDRWVRLEISDDGNIVAVNTSNILLPGITTPFTRLYRLVIDNPAASRLVSKDYLGNPIESNVLTWDGSGDLNWFTAAITGSDIATPETLPFRSIYRYSATDDVLTRISTTASGGGLDSPTDYPSISDDGTRIAFFSRASDVAGLEGVDATAFVWTEGSGFKALPIPADTSSQWFTTISGDGTQVHLGSSFRRRYDLALDSILDIGPARTPSPPMQMASTCSASRSMIMICPSSKAFSANSTRSS